MTEDRILIVGGGIVGLSTAWALVGAGRAVTVIEQGPIPNPVASSADHHRLIRYPYGAAEGYCARIGAAFAAWREMWADLPGDEGRYYANTGILSLCQWASDHTDVSRQVMERLGIGFERIDDAAEIARRLPFLETANLSYALLSEGGALMANHILVDLAEGLRWRGAEVLEHATVTAIDPDAGEVRLADGRVLAGAQVVVAAGVATAGLLPAADLPLTPHRTVIVYADPPEDLAEAYDGAPCWTGMGGDTDLWGVAAIDGLPMKLGNGGLGRREPSVSERAMDAAEVARLLAGYRGRFRGIERFRVHFQQANYWTHAPEERFLLARTGRALAVSACSGHGFKFGALTGRDVAEALSDAGAFARISDRIAGRAA